MPIVPQFYADAPAAPRAPAMETERRAPVDASAQLRAMAGLADRLAGGVAENPQFDPSFGQNRFRGAQALGEGVRALGQFGYEVSQRAAEARNIAEEHAAQIALEKEVGEFEKWRLSPEGSDPNKWESEWWNRASTWRDQYFKGKEISPAAEEAIRLRTGTFIERQGIQVGVEAVKQVSAAAREAVGADAMRSVEARDLNGLNAVIQRGLDAGVLAEDDAVRMQIQGREQIERKSLSETVNFANALVLEGRLPEAKELISTAPIPPDERAVMIAKFEKIDAVQVQKGEVLQRVTVDGEDPRKVIADLDSKDAKGDFRKYEYLNGAARAELKAALYEAEQEEVSEIVKTINEGISAGSVTVDNLEERVGGKRIPSEIMDAFRAKIRGEQVATADKVLALFGEASKYDPTADPYGTIRHAIGEKVSVILGDDPRRVGIEAILEKRAKGEELTAGERFKAQKLEEVEAISEAKGSWIIPAKRIKPVERDGETIFVDTGADVKPEDPSYFNDDRGLFKPAITGRIVQLSQEDRIKVVEGKAVNVEDLNRKHAEKAATAEHLDVMARAFDKGEIKTDTEANQKWDSIVAPRRKDAAESVIEGGLFPDALIPSENMDDPEELRSWIMGVETTF